MTTWKNISQRCDEGAISQLVQLARQQGKTDIFLGKRHRVRYAFSMQLEVATDPEDESTHWPAIMHNVSGGGIGLWSKQKLEIGTAVYVCQYSENGPKQWIPARVAHCTIGIQGFLIGIAFNSSSPEDILAITSEEPDRQVTASESIDTICAEPAAPLRSLRTKCIYASVAAGGIAVMIAIIACHYTWSKSWPIWPMTITILVSLGLCALAGWSVMAGEVQFLKQLGIAMRKLAKGSTDPYTLDQAPSRELGSIRRAFMDMRTTWRKRQDDERIRREKLEELTRIKSNILSIVSHDLRTPLTSILLYARMLSEELNTLAEEDQRRFLKIISDECNRLSRLVDDLLEVQRLETDRVQWNMQAHDLSETIESCQGLFKAMAISKSINLIVDCPDSLPPIKADADKISQMLSNLLSNALKYTPNGGTVRLSAEINNNEILLCVEDTGLGIPRDKWDQIFDRFSRLNDPNVQQLSGVGLGLYIVKKIVESHSGSVWVDSEVGRGSQFYVSLPIKPSKPMPSTNQENVSLARRAVICDADPELVAIIAQTLREENFDVRVAHSGARLLAQLSDAEVDVVITDLLLPDTNATELLNNLNNIPRRQFSLIVHSYAGDARDFRRRGVDIFLRRPASKKEMIQAVHTATQKHSSLGLTVLLVGSGSFDTKRLGQILSQGNHIPIVADTIEAASRLVRDYPIDVVMISSDLLTAKWSNLGQLGIAYDDNIRVIVMCNTLQRKERHLAEANGVAMLTCRPGTEEQVVAQITTFQENLVGEVNR